MADAPPLPADLAAIPPGLVPRLRDVTQLLAADAIDVGLHRLARLCADGEAWLSAAPELAELGLWMLAPARPIAVRVQGCVWLTMFPSVDVARRLAAIALDDREPLALRDQAAWSLGYRQARGHHPRARWDAAALAVADVALLTLVERATRAGVVALEQLPIALRHVARPDVVDALVAAPGLWGEALECFATAAAARALWARFDAIGAAHQLRALRLVAATLGAEAAPLLVARAEGRGPDERLELLQLAVAVGGEPYLGAIEAELATLRWAAMGRARAQWHLRTPASCRRCAACRPRGSPAASTRRRARRGAPRPPTISAR